jgi:hypothetical protein
MSVDSFKQSDLIFNGTQCRCGNLQIHIEISIVAGIRPPLSHQFVWFRQFPNENPLINIDKIPSSPVFAYLSSSTNDSQLTRIPGSCRNVDEFFPCSSSFQLVTFQLTNVRDVNTKNLINSCRWSTPQEVYRDNLSKNTVQTRLKKQFPAGRNGLRDRSTISITEWQLFLPVQEMRRIC